MVPFRCGEAHLLVSLPLFKTIFYTTARGMPVGIFIYLSIYIYVFIFKYTLNYISCFFPNPCASQTFRRIKFLALVYKPAVMPLLLLLGAPPSPPALFCHNGLLVPRQAKRFPACASLFALLFLCGIHIPQLFSRPVPYLSGVSSESASLEGLSFPGTLTPTTCVLHSHSRLWGPS